MNCKTLDEIRSEANAQIERERSMLAVVSLILCLVPGLAAGAAVALFMGVAASIGTAVLISFVMLTIFATDLGEGVVDLRRKQLIRRNAKKN